MSNAFIRNNENLVKGIDSIVEEYANVENIESLKEEAKKKTVNPLK